MVPVVQAQARAPYIRERAAWMNNDLLRERDPETGKWVSCITISDAQAGRYFTKILRAHTVSRKNAKMQDHGRADVVENRQQHCRLRLRIAQRSLHLPVPDFLVSDIQRAVDAVVLARKQSVVSMAALAGWQHGGGRRVCCRYHGRSRGLMRPWLLVAAEGSHSPPMYICISNCRHARTKMCAQNTVHTRKPTHRVPCAS